MFAVGGWLDETKRVYFQNATSVRDYRVQLRGSRSVILFGLYLFILIGAAFFAYDSSTRYAGGSIVDAQRQLHTFAATVMGMLGGAIALVAPGLSATAVVLEKQRQSLDLVFSGPVTPKYYLVGKMMSSYRYSWMLLVLALPIVAASVVLGGASWYDVLTAFIQLSAQGLILTAIALLMSTMAVRPVSAIIWSYAATIVYCIASSLISVSYVFSRTFGGMSGIGSNANEAPWYVTMSPLTALDTSRSVTVAWGVHVPNWIFAVLFALATSKIFVLAAGTQLSFTGGREIPSLRIHSLLYGFLLSYAIGCAVGGSVSAIHSVTRSAAFGSTPMAVTASDTSSILGRAFCGMTSVLVLFIAYLSCFGYDREHRYWPNGLVSWKSIWNGTPAGNLPFLLMTLLLASLGMGIGAGVSGVGVVSGFYWIYVGYAISFWVLMFAIGRMVSSFFGGLRNSRVLVFVVLIAITSLPLPFLTAVGRNSEDPTNSMLWNFYFLSPLLGDDATRVPSALMFAALMTGAAVVLLFLSELRARSKMVQAQKYDEQA